MLGSGSRFGFKEFIHYCIQYLRNRVRQIGEFSLCQIAKKVRQDGVGVEQATRQVTKKWPY